MQSKHQNYMKNGGLIIFDTRDAIPSNIIANNQSVEQNILRSILKSSFERTNFVLFLFLK